MSTGGTYVLAIDVPEPTTVEVGALGAREFAGAYAYVGSAFGPGGFARVDRRRSVLRRVLARGARENATANWPAAIETPTVGASSDEPSLASLARTPLARRLPAGPPRDDARGGDHVPRRRPRV